MTFDYAGLSRFTFLSVGFWVVMVVGIAFALVFAVGPTRGKKAARLWVELCAGLAVIGGVADVVWAMMTGEWTAFVRLYGYTPIIEMVLLAVLLLGIMWFLAIRYTDGLKD